MRGVFISYRKDDAAGFAGRIADHLEADFGRAKVFRDDDILLGENFETTIKRRLDGADVVLAVIGHNWLANAEGKERPRLFEADDWVRFELKSALQAGRRIIPVLVGRGALPDKADLPENLQPLLSSEAFAVRDQTFEADLARLSREIGVPWRRLLWRTASAAVGLTGVVALVLALFVIPARNRAALRDAYQPVERALEDYDLAAKNLRDSFRQVGELAVDGDQAAEAELARRIEAYNPAYRALIHAKGQGLAALAPQLARAPETLRRVETAFSTALGSAHQEGALPVVNLRVLVEAYQKKLPAAPSRDALHAQLSSYLTVFDQKLVSLREAIDQMRSSTMALL